MAAQQGFLYEENAAAVLKKLNIVPKNFQPAGASHDQPDLMLQHKKKTAGCELKIMDASAGSLVLKYDIKAREGQRWKFNEIDAADEEKMFLKNLAEQEGVLKYINKHWGTPLKVEGLKWGSLTPEQKDKFYRADLKTCPDTKAELKSTAIEEYYKKKKTYYVNIGTTGFYLFGTTDPLKLNDNPKLKVKVPVFSDSSTASYRVRVQYKGGGNYQYTFELQFKMKVKSPYNIAPITSKGNVSIDMAKLNVECFK